MRRLRRFGTAFLLTTASTVLGLGATTGTAFAAVDCNTAAAVIDPSTFTMNHLDGTSITMNAVGNVRPGDIIVAQIHLNPECPTVQVTGASYIAPSEIFSVENQEQQVLFDSVSQTVDTNGAPTVVTLTLHVPTGPSTTGGTCPNKHNDSSQAYNGNGGSAADGNQYASTCDGRASQNGNGNGKANGKPCQGCVGNADNKNPPGQSPNGSDANAGYECDRNNGVGKGNPAHTDCQPPVHFQIDFVVGPVITNFFANGIYTPYPFNTFITHGSTLG